MRRNVLVKTSLAAVGTLLASGCGNGRRDNSNQRAISYAPREPGSTVGPTNDMSYHLLANSGPDRLYNLRVVLLEAGQKCAVVTSGVLLGGLDETDEWRVQCSDTGSWAIWFKPSGAPEVRHCSVATCKN
jgi:hypothetical protein